MPELYSLVEGELIESSDRKFILVHASPESSELIAIEIEILVEFGNLISKKMQSLNEVTGQSVSEIISKSILNELIEDVLTAKLPNFDDSLCLDISSMYASEIFKNLDPGFDLFRSLSEIETPPHNVSYQFPDDSTQNLSSQTLLSNKSTSQDREIPLTNSSVQGAQNLSFTGTKCLGKIRPKPIIRRPPIHTRMTQNLEKKAQDTIETDKINIPVIDYSVPKERARKQKLLPMNVGNFKFGEEPARPLKKRGRKRKYDFDSYEPVTDEHILPLPLEKKTHPTKDEPELAPEKTEHQCKFCQKFLKNLRTLQNHTKVCPKFCFDVTESIADLCIEPKSREMEVDSDPKLHVNSHPLDDKNSNPEPKLDKFQLIEQQLAQMEGCSHVPEAKTSTLDVPAPSTIDLLEDLNEPERLEMVVRVIQPAKVKDSNPGEIKRKRGRPRKINTNESSEEKYRARLLERLAERKRTIKENVNKDVEPAKREKRSQK